MGFLTFLKYGLAATFLEEMGSYLEVTDNFGSSLWQGFESGSFPLFRPIQPDQSGKSDQK